MARKKKYKIRTIKEKVQIVNYYQKQGYRATIKKFGAKQATVVYWIKKLAQGSVNGKHPLARKDKRHTIREDTVAVVKKIHREQPHLTLRQIREIACKTQRISCTTVWHIIKGR